jgi:hypothetical protein
MKKTLLLCAISILGINSYAQKGKFYDEISLNPDESSFISLDSVRNYLNGMIRTIVRIGQMPFQSCWIPGKSPIIRFGFLVVII